MRQSFSKFRMRLIKTISLEDIDQHQSFQFLKRKYNVEPSELITIFFIIIGLLFILLDGFTLASSLCNFAFPVYSLYMEINRYRQGKISLKIKSQEQNSRLTDEQFSQVLSNNFFSRSEILQVYIVYFIFYISSEFMTPIMDFIIGSMAWLIVRCIGMVVMIKTKHGVAVLKVLMDWLGREQALAGRRRVQKLVLN